METGTWISYQELHTQLGHAHERQVKATVKRMGWTVTRAAEKCSDCALAKSRKKNIPKEAKKSQTMGKQICMDILSIKAVS